MQKALLTKDVFLFLEQLKKNNNKEWFNQNKETFKVLENSVREFFNGVFEDLKVHDEIEKFKMQRIYRDIRFSKDKTPYKSHFGASFSRLGARLRGGYYIHLKPGESFIATGFWEPNTEDLFRIRKEFEMDATSLKEVIHNENFKAIWGALQGDALKTAPKGFDKTHPELPLIRKKQFYFMRNFSDKEVFSANFRQKIAISYVAIRPFFDVMSDVLTTNLNGESLLD